MSVLANCKPKDVFKYFEIICSIPHGSWDEKALSDYIFNWAKELGYNPIQDNLNNLIIKKPATPGYELAPSVIIQGHLDMVCEKNADVEFDFAKDPLNIYVDGDYIKAKGTTLGADNGIAVAMAMALLADKSLKHPALEIVLTTVEEAGMDGAKNIDPSLLDARRLINIDSEDEGVFLSSCAGGAKVSVTLDIVKENLQSGSFLPLTVFIGGLRGGHSGMDIAKERGNSNKLLGRILDGIKTPYHIASIGGGSKDNAIPREAFADILVEKNNKEELTHEVKAIEAMLKAEYEAADPDLFIEVRDSSSEAAQVFSPPSKKQAIDLLLAIPYGVDHMSAALPGLVETSNNLGVVKTEGNQVFYTCAVRSSRDSRKWALTRSIEVIAEALGAKAATSSGYSGWAYSPVSELREIFKDVYKKKYGADAQVLAIHAGVECGIFADKIPSIDMISFGPNMHDVHTPDERVSISSTSNCYEFLVDVLAYMTQ